jgi:hypothetical protein
MYVISHLDRRNYSYFVPCPIEDDTRCGELERNLPHSDLTCFTLSYADIYREHALQIEYYSISADSFVISPTMKRLEFRWLGSAVSWRATLGCYSTCIYSFQRDKVPFLGSWFCNFLPEWVRRLPAFRRITERFSGTGDRVVAGSYSRTSR